MTLPPDYLSYPRRRLGMDHDLYDWSALPTRPSVIWPGGASLALWVIVPIGWYPLTLGPQPRPPLGAFDDPHPNFRDYTHRDYGNRIGIFRVMNVLDRYGIRPTAPVSAAICRRYPALLREIQRRNWEIAAYGLDLGHQHDASLPIVEERDRIREVVQTVGEASGTPVFGWMSPANSQSANTLELLAENGLHYTCDWANDELPYCMRTKRGSLWVMPYSHDMNDAAVIWHGHHSPPEFGEQVADQFVYLRDEAARAGAGRILTLVLHPWCIGQPHRIAALDTLLKKVATQKDVWQATGIEMLQYFRENTGSDLPPPVPPSW